MLIPVFVFAFVFLLPLAAHTGRAHPDAHRPSIARLRVRQNRANSTTSRPPSTSTGKGGVSTCTSQGWALCGTACVDVANGATCCDNGASSCSGTRPTTDGRTTSPVTTTYGPITATVAGNPVTLAFSGEVLPLQTLANHNPVPSEFIEAVFAELGKDPATKAFGDLLTQAPSVFEGLEAKKKYYLFVPTTEFVVDYLRNSQENPPGLGPRNAFADPKLSQQFAEKPAGGPDIWRQSATLKTTLAGETKYSNLGEGEGARLISNPTGSENGSVQIVSGLGHSTLVYPDEIPFGDGVILKCDGFFTLPRPIDTVFANTSGHLWSKALENAKMLKPLSEDRKVTLFAVQDSALNEADLPAEADLKRYIHDGLSYTPDMSDQPCLSTRDGGSVRITTKGNDRFANGIRISTSNIMARNGVIHYLEGKIPRADKCSGSGRNSAPSTVALSMIAVLGLSAASLSAYLWV